MATDGDFSITIDNDSDKRKRILSCSPTNSPFLSNKTPLIDGSAPTIPFPSKPNANSWSISRVPWRLREVNAKAYEPNAIPIGPYGRLHIAEHSQAVGPYGCFQNTEHWQAMEVVKKNCFSGLIEETKLDRSTFVEAMQSIAERVEKCYKYHLADFKCENFAEMLVHDGCFIVQLIRRKYPKEDFCQLERIQTDIRYDLLLFENQLPFFVLFELYRIITRDNGENALDKFASLALSFFTEDEDRGQEIWSKKHRPTATKNIKHLLGLVHDSCLPPRRDIKKKSKSQCSWKFIRCATELEEAGINFFGDSKNKLGVESLFDIKFTDDTKVLKIPTFHVDDNTERILRNLMAYEQSIPSSEPTYFCDYVTFMDNLINTAKDVQLLCNCGVIDNWLGDDEAVAQMFNKLRNCIYLSKDFYYAETYGKVNEHCERKWNKWKATLKRDYFNSPWSLISFLAAVVLLLLTMIQTLFSALSYGQQ